MSNLTRRHAWGAITPDNATAVVARLADLLTGKRFVVVQYATRPSVVDLCRVLTDRMLSLATWPHLDAPVSVEGENVMICTAGERWFIPFGSEFGFSADDEQVRFVVKQFDAVRVFAVQRPLEELEATR